jgi:FkbM family methyltransferase
MCGYFDMQFREQIKLCLRWFTLPIKDGPLKGMRWIAASGARFIRGTYEPDKTEAFHRCVNLGDIVYDVGGHVGYYSVLCSKLTGPTGKVLAFEPRPLNSSYIRHHIKINDIKNICLFDAAVSNVSGEASFESRTGTGTGHLSGKGNLNVKTIVLDEFVFLESHPPPDFLKIDIEGGEVNALNGAKKLLAKVRPKLLVATHGKKESSFVLNLLEQNKYEYEILNPDAVKGDTEILAFPKEGKG